MYEKFIPVGYEEFCEVLKEAKSSIDEWIAWRVQTYDPKYYESANAKCYITERGSTIAVAQDGEILSFCRHNDDKIRGNELVYFARDELGGNHLECYEAFEDFYQKCGFQEIYRLKWDDRMAPKDWKPEFGKEDIVFFEIPQDDLLFGNDRVISKGSESIVNNKRQQDSLEVELTERTCNYIERFLQIEINTIDDVKRFKNGLKYLDEKLSEYGIALETLSLPIELQQSVVQKWQVCENEQNFEINLQNNSDSHCGPINDEINIDELYDITNDEIEFQDR